MIATPYRALVESASQLIAVDALADFEEQNLSGAAGFLDQNRHVLDSARHLLTQKCCVSVRYERSFLSDRVDDFSHLRNLARAFRVEALWAASREDFGRVALVGEDVLELANAVRRGGLVVDLLVGLAISGLALDLLRKFRGHFDEAVRLTLGDAQRRLEREREPFADIYARDREWERAVGMESEECDFEDAELMDPTECGMSHEEQRALIAMMQQFADRPESEQREVQHDLDRHILALMRMLDIDLALRSWHAQAGTYPGNLRLLVPQYLPEIPTDPFTGAPFIYRPVDRSSFLLYSTGPKKTDDGGTFGPWPSVASGVADLCLDENDYRES